MAFSQNVALQYLDRAHSSERLGHTYLIIGSNQTSWEFACRVAALVNMKDMVDAPWEKLESKVLAHPDIHVAEPESKSRRIIIEQIRGLEAALRLSATTTTAATAAQKDFRKIVILRDADRLQPQAANAFLKTLEEPPDHSLILLLTSQPEVVLETILSRCIKISLTPDPHETSAEDKMHHQEKAILSRALCEYAAKSTPILPDAYQMFRAFQECLHLAKARLTEETHALLKEEEKHYSQTTETGDRWLAEREKTLQARTEAKYLTERGQFLDYLSQFWGDVLRRQSVGANFKMEFRTENPAHATAVECLAERVPTADILKKLNHLEDLRVYLERNIQEALALEVVFLQTFGE